MVGTPGSRAPPAHDPEVVPGRYFKNDANPQFTFMHCRTVNIGQRAA
jgi:hypothetical protein